MSFEQVHCERKLSVNPDNVWAMLRNFDLSWHPFVTSCKILHNTSGALVREFDTSDGGHLIEQRTYHSDTDRVLAYTALSGIEGATSYKAQVEVKVVDDNQSLIIWQADIEATDDRSAAIAAGTRLVFEAAFDALEDAPQLSLEEEMVDLDAAKTELTTGSVGDNPRLSYLTSARVLKDGKKLVLFLHGIGGQASNWLPQIEELGSKYHVVAMNLRGYGDSTLGPEQTRIDDYCDDIKKIADHFGVTSFILVGLSMGSWIATSFAMRFGDQLIGLVLAGGCTGMSEADTVERENFLRSRELPLSQGQTPADFAEGVVKVITGPNANDQVKSELKRSMSEITSTTYKDALNCFCNPVEVFDFSKISCPVLILTGEHDKLAPPQEIRHVSQRIHKTQNKTLKHQDIQFEVIKDAGHLCNLEQQDTFNELLSKFLERVA